MPKFSKILVVDDAELDRTILVNILKKNGYTVFSASDANEGIALARVEMPDLIMMDVVMPTLSGFEATRILKDDPKTQHIPVVICSTKGLTTDQMWGKRQGAVEYVVKPIKEGDVLAKICAVEAK